VVSALDTNVSFPIVHDFSVLLSTGQATLLVVAGDFDLWDLVGDLFVREVGLVEVG
jgi:hypothetical protein